MLPRLIHKKSPVISQQHHRKLIILLREKNKESKISVKRKQKNVSLEEKIHTKSKEPYEFFKNALNSWPWPL